MDDQSERQRVTLDVSLDELPLLNNALNEIFLNRVVQLLDEIATGPA
ncbi:MAG TPA: hypothetical protein VKE40_18320 [Gemmataceae bacterium]|nr:hypothetical protein [Gemmataceae bacterium]